MQDTASGVLRIYLPRTPVKGSGRPRRSLAALRSAPDADRCPRRLERGRAEDLLQPGLRFAPPGGDPGSGGRCASVSAVDGCSRPVEGLAAPGGCNARTRAVSEVTKNACRDRAEPPRLHLSLLDARPPRRAPRLPLEHDEGLVLVRVGVSGVVLPLVIRSSNRRNAPPVSSAVAFMIHRPPPANQRRSPSPSWRTIGTAVPITLSSFRAPSAGLSLVGLIVP